MKEYVKPSFEFVELRIEERLARCYFEPITNDVLDIHENNEQNHSADLPGNHPGCRYHCPHS